MTSNFSNPGWNTSYKAKCGWTIFGRSRARESTGFYVQGPNIHLDGGVPCRAFKTNIILLTHGHFDHCGAMPNLLRGEKSQPALVFAPQKIIQRLFRHVKSSWQCKIDKDELPSHFEFDDEKRNYEKPFADLHSGIWFPVNSNSSNIELNIDKIIEQYNIELHPWVKPFKKQLRANPLFITAIQCFHTTVDVGYVLYEERVKLKSEYMHLTGKEIAAAKKAGENINQSLKVPQMAYICDTTIKVLQDPDTLSRITACATVMIECTFLEKEIEEEAEKRGHICWTQLEPFTKKFPETEFILFHFSLRYTKDTEIAELLSDRPANVKLWLESGVI